MKRLKYTPEIFFDNIKTLLRYGWEPEIEIIFLNGEKRFIVVYLNCIDIIDAKGRHKKVKQINDIIKNEEWLLIKEIIESNGVDLSIPISKQSIIIDGVLWLNCKKIL